MSFGTLLTGNHRLSVRKREKLSPRNGQVDIDIVHGFSYWAYCSGTTYSTNTYVFRRKYTPNIYIYHPTKPWKRRRRMGSLKTMFPHRVPVAPLSTCALNWRPLGALPPPVEGIKDCSNVWVIPPFLKALPPQESISKELYFHSRDHKGQWANKAVSLRSQWKSLRKMTGEEGGICIQTAKHEKQRSTD